MTQAGFNNFEIDYWTFIPRGDMPARYARLSRILDVTGRFALPRYLRGGLILTGRKEAGVSHIE